VLRECVRVLKPGGMLASVAIEAARGLAGADRLLASELGPTDVHAPDSLRDMVTGVGMEPVHVEDWTAPLRATARELGARLEAAADAIRAAEGDTVYEEERGKKARMVEGIDRGLLVRTLVVARKPSAS
jgi:hypothetical protein